MNDNMMFNLDEEEMLELWKTRLRLLPARRDCTIERDDGIDIDQVLLLDIKEWYAWLLWHGDASLLPVEDLSGDVSPQIDDEGVVTVLLPSVSVARCVVRPADGSYRFSQAALSTMHSYLAKCM